MAQSQALQSQEKKELVSKDETTVPVRYFVPTTDIFETEDALTVVMEVPGVNKEAVDISVENDVLKIEAKIDPSKYDGMEPLYTEYNVGHFARSFTLSNKREYPGGNSRRLPKDGSRAIGLSPRTVNALRATLKPTFARFAGVLSRESSTRSNAVLPSRTEKDAGNSCEQEPDHQK